MSDLKKMKDLRSDFEEKYNGDKCYNKQYGLIKVSSGT